MAEENDTPEVEETVETPAEEVVEATPDATENAADAGPVDEVEGGTVPVDGEAGVAVAVRAVDAEAARSVLGSDRP